MVEKGGDGGWWVESREDGSGESESGEVQEAVRWVSSEVKQTRCCFAAREWRVLLLLAAVLKDELQADGSSLGSKEEAVAGEGRDVMATVDGL